VSCFLDYIYSKGCGGVSPSGLYIESLPRITTPLLNALADEHQVDFKGYYEDVQKRAIGRFMTDARAEFARNFRMQSIIDSVRQRQRKEDSTVTADSKYRGQEILFDYWLYNKITRSNLRLLRLNEVSVYIPSLPVSGVVEVKLFETEFEIELDSWEITSAGWNTIAIDKEYEGFKFFIGYDSSEIDPVKSEVPSLYRWYLTGSPNNRSGSFWGYSYTDIGAKMWFRGAEADISNPYELSTGSDSYGLVVSASVQCSIEPIICQNRNLFARALQYLIGAEIMEDALRSSNVSNVLSFDREQFEFALTDFTAEYRGGTDSNEVDRPGELKQVISNIELDKNDACIICGQEVKIVRARV